jgi:hypothetical protein
MGDLNTEEDMNTEEDLHKEEDLNTEEDLHTEDLATETSDWALGITNESYRPEQAGKQALNYIKLQFNPSYTEYFAKSFLFIFFNGSFWLKLFEYDKCTDVSSFL